VSLYSCSSLSPQLVSSRLIYVGLDPGGVTCRRDSEAQVSQNSQKVKSVINGIMNTYLKLLGSTCIYRVLIMFGYAMGWALAWALVWAVSGLGP